MFHTVVLWAYIQCTVAGGNLHKKNTQPPTSAYLSKVFHT